MATKLSYGEQLKHPLWQRKRLERLNAAGWACMQCDSKETTLHVHHKRYVKGRMAWEYEEVELDVLCEDCHLSEHALKDLLDELLSKSTGWMPLQTAVALVGGYFTAGFDVPSSLTHDITNADRPNYTIGVLARTLGLASCADLVKFISKVAEDTGGVDPVLQRELEWLQTMGSQQLPSVAFPDA